MTTDHERKIASDMANTASKMAEGGGTLHLHENARYLHGEAASLWNDLRGDRGGARAANHHLAIEKHDKEIAKLKRDAG